MISAGIDIGSRTVKLALVEDGRIVAGRMAFNTFDPLSVCRELLAGLEIDRITATGYGRHLFRSERNCDMITEIKAFALGARALFGNCRTILDIGGQDIKAISLDEAGRVRKFEMNDKCSAGTGRFLEIMAMSLACSLDEFSGIALGTKNAEKVNSTCTVFAESEVVSLLARGAAREDVASGIHHSIIARAKSMLCRIEVLDDVVFVGGVARNACAVRYLEQALGMRVLSPDDPQIVGAYGCALHGTGFTMETRTCSDP